MHANMLFGMWVALAFLMLAWLGGHSVLNPGVEGFDLDMSFRMGINPGQPPFSNSDTLSTKGTP